MSLEKRKFFFSTSYPSLNRPAPISREHFPDLLPTRLEKSRGILFLPQRHIADGRETEELRQRKSKRESKTSESSRITSCWSQESFIRHVFSRIRPFRQPQKSKKQRAENIKNKEETKEVGKSESDRWIGSRRKIKCGSVSLAPSNRIIAPMGNKFRTIILSIPLRVYMLWNNAKREILDPVYFLEVLARYRISVQPGRIRKREKEGIFVARIINSKYKILMKNCNLFLFVSFDQYWSQVHWWTCSPSW